jgi:ABC-type microcin C transport system permease subunit YejE
MKLKSRRQRRFEENVKKFGVWIFLLLFVASIAGVVVITASVAR